MRGKATGGHDPSPRCLGGGRERTTPLGWKGAESPSGPPPTGGAKALQDKPAQRIG